MVERHFLDLNKKYGAVQSVDLVNKVILFSVVLHYLFLLIFFFSVF